MRSKRGGSRTARGVALALALGAGALAFGPATAAADPSEGCTATGSPGPNLTTYTCYAEGDQGNDSIRVSGYEVKQNVISTNGVPTPPGGGMITAMSVDVVDQNTDPVPISRLMLHHIVFFNQNTAGGRTDGGCGGAQRFYGAGEERLRLIMPPGFGYELKPADTWSLIYMFMNHRAQTDEAWIEYEVTVDTSGTLEPVRPYWLDVGDCALDPIYNVPGVDRPPAPPKCKKAGKRAKRGARRKAGKCRKLAKKRKRERTELEASQPTHTEVKDVTAKEDGWIVAGAGHVHGGAKLLTLTKPGCPGNPEVARSVPTWGLATHPFYNVKPVLHEPGPIGMSGFVTPTGIPLADGQPLRVNSVYDNLQPHSRVMGIYIAYVAADAPGGAEPAACGGAPPDIAYDSGTGGVPGRSAPPPFKVPLTGLDQSGTAVEIDGPPGPFADLGLGSTVQVGDRSFSEPNVSLEPGGVLNYSFNGNETHNVTLANGPMGIGTENSGGPWSDAGPFANQDIPQTFTRTGTYRLFCTWHPVQMQQRVVVKSKKKKKKKKKRA